MNFLTVSVTDIEIKDGKLAYSINPGYPNE